MAVQLPPDSTGKNVDTVVVAGNHRQLTVLADPITAAAQVTVSQFHNTDNQAIGGTGYGLLTGGVAQLLNVIGNLDRQREAGIDGIAAVGVSTGVGSFAMQIAAITSTLDLAAAGTRTFTPSAMSGTITGIPWAIQVGSVLTIDTGASQENVVVASVTATTFVAVTTKIHNGTIAVTGFVYNQGRDAAGELDGANGSGTAVAAEYEYNGGGQIALSGLPSGSSFDRARSLQAKGQGAGTITNNPLAAGSTSLTLAAAPAGLTQGEQIILDRAGANPEINYVATNFVPGALSVPLKYATVYAHALSSTVEWDNTSANGPGLVGFTPMGVGIEEEALFCPTSKRLYIERSADVDGMGGFNVVAEAPALYNGGTVSQDGFAQPTFDRAKSTSLANFPTTATLTARNAVGAVVTEKTSRWSVISNPIAGTQASASLAAEIGVRHVCDSISFSAAATVAPALTALTVNLRDGASGLGTIIWTAQLAIPAATGQAVVPIMFSGLNLVGSTNTAMTLEFSAGLANLIESVSIAGFNLA